MAAHGVDTLFLETGNSGQATDVVRPGQLGRLVDAAHDAGLRVVAWYLPTLLYPARDLRRVLAAVRFTTPTGGRFDSFALDIEASDVRTVSLRNDRLVALSAALRAAVGPGYPLGAIVPSAVGMEHHPKYWPAFPYAALGHSVDVFLPMAYFTYRVKGRGASARYVQRSVALLRAGAGAGVPVHVIGGVAGSASIADVRGFMDAVARCSPVGYSLYDFPITSAAAWAAARRRRQGRRPARAPRLRFPEYAGRDARDRREHCRRVRRANARARGARALAARRPVVRDARPRAGRRRNAPSGRPSSATATGSSTRRRSGASRARRRCSSTPSATTTARA